jgi:hypothetical protein
MSSTNNEDASCNVDLTNDLERKESRRKIKMMQPGKSKAAKHSPSG